MTTLKNHRPNPYITVIEEEEEEGEEIIPNPSCEQPQAIQNGYPIQPSPSTASTVSELDASHHYVRGQGILASTRELNVPEDKFVQGCRLLLACARGDIQHVDYLLKSHPSHINFRDYDRRTALHVASSEGHLDLVKHLVEKGAQVNRSDRWGGSPLDDAHRHRHLEVAAYLRSNSAKTGSADRTTNLITAAATGDVDEVRVLIDMYATTPDFDVNDGDYDRRTALHLAAGEGHADIVELLCRSGADVNAVDRWGGRPLDDARRSAQHACVEVLMRYNAKKGSWHPSKNVANHILDDGDLDDSANKSDALKFLKVNFEELEMIEKIGQGAFGVIFKCRWRGTLVAAKCIKSGKIQDAWAAKHGKNEDEAELGDETKEVAMEDFRIEVGILRNLRHPNICMLLAYSTTENYEVMISELMQCSLLDVFNANAVNNTNLPKRKQLFYAQQLAQGMNYLHLCKPPIIHRDIKPANLLIDYSGTLKITDFGLAKIRPDPMGHQQAMETEAFVMTGETGSYRFMAPEVFRHQPYNETVDVYSYAMIFFYLLSGQPPWPTLNGVKAAMAAALEGRRPHIPRDWDIRFANLLQKCWDENPQLRPSFSDIIKVLGEYSKDVWGIDQQSVAQISQGSKCCTIS